MIEYGGVPLPQPTPEVRAFIEANLSLSDCYQFDVAGPVFYGPDDHPQIHIGRLHWPTGAQRWAVAWYLVSEEQAALLRELAYGGETSSPLTLVISTGTWGLETSLYMLPPAPIQQVEFANGLYLLTLVDDRYFWPFRRGAVSIEEGTTSWADLYQQIGDTLGVEIDYDPIPDAYLNPRESIQPLSTELPPLPPLLDRVAARVGQKIVRTLDGQVLAQNGRNGAIQDQLQLVQPYPHAAGGVFGTEAV